MLAEKLQAFAHVANGAEGIAHVYRVGRHVVLLAGEDGSFLVRPSSQSQNSLSLTMCHRRRLYNIGIRHRSDGRYALGTEKEKEQVHS